MSSKEVYCVGARVWVRDPECVWRGATLKSDYVKDVLTVELEDSGEERELAVKDDSELPPLRNPDILIGENDLTSLSYLHEPAVLYNLRVRFANHGSIYTYCGIVLVAINPYEELPIYGSETIWAYRGKAMGDLDPHIFAVAEEAYTKMERVNTNQAIIVSGESGAGKTVSAKYAMRYFATVGGSAEQETQIEKKVLASNPIMEAIGNAKTIRNDNSSRFGKFIEIDFNKSYHISAANMRTYLLEKSRVVFQAADERNYHIFYQLCSVADREEFQELELGHQDEFFYLNQGGSPTIAGVDDARCFDQTREALTLLGLERRVQTALFRTLAAVLHLGNVQFREEMAGGEEACSVTKGDKCLPVVARLLNVDHEQIRHWLCKRKIVSMRETFTKSMNLKEATSSRDALAKHIYAQVFSHIVSRINKSLETREKVHRFIGVLDIYGFETFEVNSFEQFCINYANEKLQQQFNQHVFKLEQEEYVKEQIEWTFIDFYDNQPCIDLIETRLGVLDLLDEECRMPKGSDHSWVEKLYDKCRKSDHFEKPRLSNTAYVIVHFADKVEYESAGFLEKNRDTVLEEQINVLRASLDPVVSGLFAAEKPAGKLVPVKAAAAGKPATQNKKTVGSQFRESLSMLMTTLNSTTPHYVRCIKPNDRKEAFGFEPHRAVQQLRACGVLETIRISAAGFPSRWLYQEFFYRYRVLCTTKDIQRNDMRVTCENILSNLIKDEDKFKFGRTKIFFRAGQVAYMEKLRGDRLRACGIMIQKHVRGWLLRKRYQTVRGATCTLQRWVRGFMARRRVRHLRRTAAAVLLQSQARGFVARRRYQRLQRLALGLQARARGLWARQRYQRMRQDRAAVVIQRHVRGLLCRRRYARTQRQIVLLQSCVRRLIAKRQLKSLKIEARSIDHQKKLNKGLENKIISLQQRITELSSEHSGLKQRQAEFDQLTADHRKLKTEAAELRRQTGRLAELEAELAQLRQQLDQERCEKVDLVNERDRIEKEGRDRIQQLNEENEKLRQQIIRDEELKQKQELESKELLKTKVNLEKSALNAEYDQERMAYQRLVQENARLEQRNETLEKELQRARGGKTHKRSSSNVSGASEATTEAARDDISDLPSITSDLHDELSSIGQDIGYGSVRSRTSDQPERNLENIDWSKQNGNPDLDKTIVVPERKPLPSPDVNLVLKLQQKLKEVEADRDRLERRLERLEQGTPDSENKQAHDQIRLQDLEMENAKLKADLQKLRQSIASGSGDDPGNDLMLQFHALQDELERRREECIQLRTVIANNASWPMRSLEDRDTSEEGEVLMAFETQKQINRQLAEELHLEKEERVRLLQMEAEYRQEMTQLKADNERQQKLISQNLGSAHTGQNEAIMQHEITRLTAENLDLREKIDNLAEQVKKYKKQLKLYAKKLKDMGGAEPSAEQLEGGPADGSGMPAIRHKSVEYVGMFEYKKEDEELLIRSLIFDLRPKTAAVLLPGLPAYILFMCIRHTDLVNDDEKVRRLLTAAINGVKRVVKKRRDDVETLIMWLANVCRLLHNLKQYSGDKAFQSENTEKQNEQCLKSFDLSEYRQVLSDVAMWIYQLVIKQLEERVQPVVVPAVLEHEAIAGLTGRPAGIRGRAGSSARQLESPVSSEAALDALHSSLKKIHRTLGELGVDPEITAQIFKQLFYSICAHSLNNLLLRKELCHWTKGMQIRYNLSHLEQWCRDNRLHDPETGVMDTLQPIIQASQLLQARKTEEDVARVCDMCDKLTTPQIIKILNLYTPDEYEERVPISFIRKVQEHLQQHRDPETDGSARLLMDSKFAFPVRFPFNPSNIRLEDIEIPDILNLPMLKKL
ncbi:unconventional myosin-Vb-like isoform X1 [Amphibalanus amphitrite]|uniref:unconventional myosin-Vb-like isoform X1 n=1 Tax=Amphibalanus amphitrite TaxID=1232801 RepID=UPI001C904EC1|nr:unconventional myosin-Vb-like isoform X1 [Amphibalanus amphitrite]